MKLCELPESTRKMAGQFITKPFTFIVLMDLGAVTLYTTQAITFGSSFSLETGTTLSSLSYTSINKTYLFGLVQICSLENFSSQLKHSLFLRLNTISAAVRHLKVSFFAKESGFGKL